MQQLEMLEKTDERRCCVCKEVKSESEFHFRKVSGRQAQCKECRRVTDRQRYQQNQELFKEKARMNYQKNKEHHKALVKRRAKNSIKAKASYILNDAVKKKSLTRQPCEECGAEKADARHDDYAKPLEVRWLCRMHHKQWHAKHGEALNACTVRHWTPPQEATQ